MTTIVEVSLPSDEGDIKLFNDCDCDLQKYHVQFIKSGEIKSELILDNWSQVMTVKKLIENFMPDGYDYDN